MPPLSLFCNVVIEPRVWCTLGKNSITEWSPSPSTFFTPCQLPATDHIELCFHAFRVLSSKLQAQSVVGWMGDVPLGSCIWTPGFWHLLFGEVYSIWPCWRKCATGRWALKVDRLSTFNPVFLFPVYSRRCDLSCSCYHDGCLKPLLSVMVDSHPPGTIKPK